MSTKVVNLRVPKELHERVETLASDELRSTHQQYIWMIKILLDTLEQMEDAEDIKAAKDAIKRNKFIPLQEAIKRATK